MEVVVQACPLRKLKLKLFGKVSKQHGEDVEGKKAKTSAMIIKASIVRNHPRSCKNSIASCYGNRKAFTKIEHS